MLLYSEADVLTPAAHSPLPRKVGRRVDVSLQHRAWRDLLPIIVFALMSALPHGPAAAQWRPQTSGSTASLRGVSAVSSQVAWASGSGGTVLRTVDGGRRWVRLTPPPGGDSLDFRDVHGVSASTAYLMSAGPGAQSRIYKTTDGGSRWVLQHSQPDSAFFLDAIAFWDARRGIAVSDPVRGRFVVLTTVDGGARWRPVSPDSIPPALPAEAAFAAGGAAVATHGTHAAWFGTGGAAARLFVSSDAGRSWRVVSTPLAQAAPSRGVFAVALLDGRRGVAVGGDYATPTAATGVAGITADGGESWRTPAGAASPRGYRSGLAVVPRRGGRHLIAVGTTGSDQSLDGGATWQPLDTLALNAVSFAATGAGWAVGPGGRIVSYVAAAGTPPSTR